VIAAALLLAQIAPALAEPAPVATTIAAIHADPRKFDGVVVRLRGWVNRCQALSCSIDEQSATSPAGAGQHLSIASDERFDAMIRPLLPTYVEFDARYSALCSANEVCVDRAPELTVMRLRAVVTEEPPQFEGQ